MHISDFRRRPLHFQKCSKISIISYIQYQYNFYHLQSGPRCNATQNTLLSANGSKRSSIRETRYIYIMCVGACSVYGVKSSSSGDYHGSG